MQRSVFTVLAIVSASLALAACEHTGGGGHGRHRGDGGPGGPVARGPSEGLQLKRFDLDGDGKVTRDELQRALHAEFSKYDTDRDGVLNANETRVLNDARRAEGTVISPAFDWNADGHVDFNEFANQWLSLFEQYDADHDGVVTEDEMKHAPGPRGQPGGDAGPGQGGGHGHRRGGGGGAGGS